uniref:Uncharacterized protein n=1 Tax=Melopsittacus undulatus TaxID=13146 RepID=A0A8V5FP43_MELUD
QGGGRQRPPAGGLGAASRAGRQRAGRCSIERRGVRHQLDSWRHKLIHCVGFESILEGLFGPGLLKDLSLFKGIQSLCLYLVLHF